MKLAIGNRKSAATVAGWKPAIRQIGNLRYAAGGFTMVEIALAIAVIGFALVAIIAVLPAGLQVQRDNREDTIIKQDGMYWLEAIRTGATGSVELAGFVDYVVDREGAKFTRSKGEFTNTHEVLGRLSAPKYSNAPMAQMERAISGPAVDRSSSVAFFYQLYSTVLPINPQSNLFEIQLAVKWPVRADGRQPSNTKIFRTLVSGTLVETDTNNHFFTLLPNAF